MGGKFISLLLIRVAIVWGLKARQHLVLVGISYKIFTVQKPVPKLMGNR